MIKSWRHKGLRDFFESGLTKGIQVKHAKKLKNQLALLDAAIDPADINLPGYDFHGLIGKKKGFYSIKVNGNWRVTFSFEGINAIEVNYEDYH